jgi:hypothetical protein
MLIKVISLFFDSIYGGFNDEALREFIKDVEVISIADYHFIKNDIPYLTFVIRYFPHRAELESKASKESRVLDSRVSVPRSDSLVKSPEPALGIKRVKIENSFNTS